MNRTYAIATVLSANATSYKGQMAIASRALDDFDSQGKKTSSNVAKVGTAIKIAFAAAAVAVGALAFSAVSMAADFDKAMRNVNSISMLSEQALGALGQQVIDLSKRVPQSAKLLAEGLYDIASSGFQGADGLKVLESSAMAASAGMSTTQTAAQAIVAVLNAYGLSADDAARVSDVLFQTVNVGVVSFDELASTMGNVVGMASAAKVSIEEVGAATAAMTLAGISAAEASTSLSRLLQGLIDPSDELLALFQNLGYESGFLALETLGLHGVMELLRTTTGGNVEALLTLFPEVRAARGAFALMSADGANYAKTFAAITDETKVAGATQRAFNEQMKGLLNQIELFVNKIKAGLIELGTRAIPALIDALGGIQTFGENMVDWAGQAADALGDFFTSLIESGRNVGSLLRTLATTLRPVAMALAAIVAVGIVATLTGLAQALSYVTGFLDRFHFVLIAVGTFLLTRWALAMGTAVYYQAAAAITNLITSVGGLGGAFRTAATAILSPSGLLAALALIGGGAVTAMLNAESSAKRLAKSFEDNLKPGDVRSYAEAIGAATEELRKQKEIAEGYQGATGFLKAFGEVLNPFVANAGYESREAVKALGNEVEILKNKAITASGVLRNIASALTDFGTDTAVKDLLKSLELPPNAAQSIAGYSEKLTEMIQEAAAAQGIDLSKLTLEGTDQEKIQAIADALRESLLVAANGTVTTDALSSSYESLADQTSNATDKLKAYKESLDAVFGITLSEFDANTKYVDSLVALQAQITKNREAGLAGAEGLDVYTEAGRRNRESISAAAQSALEHAEAIAATEAGLPAATEVLNAHVAEIQRYLVEMGLTPEAAAEFTNAAGLTVENLQKIATDSGTAATKLGQVTQGIHGMPAGKQVQISANTAPALDALSNVEHRISQDRSMTMRVVPTNLAQTEADLNYVARPRNVEIRPLTGPYRWGGFRMYAAGGTATSAQILRHPTAIAGEPATGGEAYIPRRGNRRRNLEILNVAAGWSNMAVVPRGGDGATQGMFGATPAFGGTTGATGGPSLTFAGPLVSISVVASTQSDQRALEATVTRAVQPAVNDLVNRITSELRTRR